MNIERLVSDTCIALSANEQIKEYTLVGSSCYHPEPKDVDFLVLVNKEPYQPILQSTLALFGEGWEATEYEDQSSRWCAIRKGFVNLIVTVDKGWYDRAKQANEVCCALKLMDKGDRIVVYRVIRDGYSADAANQRRNGSI